LELNLIFYLDLTKAAVRNWHAIMRLDDRDADKETISCGCSNGRFGDRLQPKSDVFGCSQNCISFESGVRLVQMRVQTLNIRGIASSYLVES